jgi:hypothetical protein
VAARENPNALEDTHGNGDAVSDDGRQIVDLEAQIAELSNGGGGALPDWWTVDSTLGAEKVTLSGRVVVTAPGHDKTVVIVGDVNSANDALVITDSDNPNSIAFGVDPFGYMSALGADLGSASGLVTLKVRGAVDQDAAQFFSRAGQSSLRAVDHNSNTVFRVDDDGSVHIKTGTTIQADL